MVAENRIPPDVIKALEARGHEVVVTEGWVHGKCMAIRLDRERGIILGGVSPRGKIGYALGW
jgi:gamma-glutamyltranspeptidase